MIRVICLNPVIDRMYYIDDFVAAKKFHEMEHQVYVGGKGVNIARVLSIMGVKCELYTVIGGNNGRLVKSEMEAYQVPVHAIEAEGETRTTINIMDHRNHRETEITEAGFPVNAVQEKEFLDMLRKDLEKEDIVVCSGIPAKGMKEDIYRDISGICEQFGCKCILDATGRYLKAAFPGNYYFSKPNLDEIADFFDMPMEKDNRVILEKGHQMMELGIQNLLISLGAEGGIFISDTRVFQALIPKVEVVSTIGSGDAAVAGFCIGLSSRLSVEDSVKMAMACGISNAAHSKVGFVDADMVHKILGQIQIRD